MLLLRLSAGAELMTVTVSLPVLLFSFVSAIVPRGSTVAVFDKLPVALGGALTVTSKRPVFAPITTAPPLATQLNVPLATEQLILDELVMFAKFVEVGLPYVTLTGSGSVRMTCP